MIISHKFNSKKATKSSIKNKYIIKTAEYTSHIYLHQLKHIKKLIIQK